MKFDLSDWAALVDGAGFALMMLIAEVPGFSPLWWGLMFMNTVKFVIVKRFVESYTRSKF